MRLYCAVLYLGTLKASCAIRMIPMDYLPGATRCAPPGRAQPGGVQVPGGEASSSHQVTPQSPALTSSHHEALYL